MNAIRCLMIAAAAQAFCPSFRLRHGRKLWPCVADTTLVEPEPLNPVQSAADATFDILEDAVMHARRGVVDEIRSMTGRTKVVILGSGWAAHAMIKIIDANKFQVVVVSPVNHFAFTPMLPSAAVGTVEYRSMTETMRRANPLVDYVQGKARDVDTLEKTLTLDDGTTISYDKLVCAIGVRVNDQIVPGAAQFCYRLKQVEDAVKLRASISEKFDEAALASTSREQARRLLTFAVIGGGPTGVELAGELCDFIRDIGTRLYPRLGISPRVILVHSRAQLLQQFEPEQRIAAATTLQKQGVELMLNARVNQVGHHEMNIVVDGAAVTVPYGIAVWCAGTAPQPFVETFLQKLPAEARAGRGFIAVDNWLRVKDCDDIYALGDCSKLDNPLPATAQVAAQQGAFLARFLNRGYDHSTPPKLKQMNNSAERFWITQLRGAETAPGFEFLDLGLLAYLGGGKALSELRFGDLQLGAFTGGAAFLLWKSVYIVKQVATRNRVLVTFDWFKTALFGRDITRL